eukprot:CAMPEP_0196805842 /NCGR_PEP_ID=MMETSP1362-20130617/5665_1 /TAXON_ID=163516 /ORGANISM="Leptocylindrus danicus, Strain CCMP1856" /LENGTH=847 /DNA_ID=CAMNT_0042178997 /DNA_START=230 /DNA_END=2770 /DNA_ORIENTATION=-
MQSSGLGQAVKDEEEASHVSDCDQSLKIYENTCRSSTQQSSTNHHHRREGLAPTNSMRSIVEDGSYHTDSEEGDANEPTVRTRNHSIVSAVSSVGQDELSVGSETSSVLRNAPKMININRNASIITWQLPPSHSHEEISSTTMQRFSYTTGVSNSFGPERHGHEFSTRSAFSRKTELIESTQVVHQWTSVVGREKIILDIVKSLSENVRTKLSHSSRLLEVKPDLGVKDLDVDADAEDAIKKDYATFDEVDCIATEYLEREYPVELEDPTMMKILSCIIPDSNDVEDADVYFLPGDYVEVLSIDMQWRMQLITKVVMLPEKGWDWNSNEGTEPSWDMFYHTHLEEMLTLDRIRAPEEGLRRIFGMGPWIWQQYALLRLESKLRFQDKHAHDFENFDVAKYTRELWDNWVDNPENEEFRRVYYDERLGKATQKVLIQHIMKPFDLVADAANNIGEWDFDSLTFSAYTYCSLFGTGWAIPLTILAIQVALPTLIMYHNRKYVHTNDHFDHPRYDDSWQTQFEMYFYSFTCAVDASASPATDLSREQLQIQELVVQILALLYLVTIVPTSVQLYCSCLGFDDTLFSKIMAIRKSIHGKFYDRFMQRFFYVADLFMNTTYVNILYFINLTNIMQAATPLEAILNALALEYLFQIDEELGSSAWWDPSRRWIRAGSVEIILQNSIERHILKSPALFAEKYNIPVSNLIECCDGDQKLFHNFVQAERDAKDVTFMTRDEILYERCRLLSVEKNNKRAIDNFDKQVTFFGGYPIERSRIAPGKSDHAHGLFNNYRSYRTWSRWASILYLSPVPELDKEIFCGRTSVLRQELEDEVPSFMFGDCPSLTKSSFKVW